MGFKLGKDAVLYRMTGGTWASPTWTAVTNCRDLTGNFSKGEADASVRGASWRLTVGTLKEASIDFEMIWDTGDAHFTAIQTGWLDDTLVTMLVLDGPVATTGNQGLKAEFSVIGFNKTEPLEDVQKVAVTIKPGYSANLPVWFTVP